MAHNSTDPNFPPPSLPPPEPAHGPESAPVTRRVPDLSDPTANPVSAPVPTPRVAVDPLTLAPSGDVGGDTIDGLLGDLANERRPGYLKGNVRETAGHIAAAYSTTDALAPAMPRHSDPPEAAVVLSDSLILSRDLVPTAPPLEPEATTQPIPKELVAESVRRGSSPNAPAALLANEAPAGALPPTVPRRKLDADVGGRTVLLPRTSLDDRRRTMKWAVAVATITLGVFAVIVFLVKMPDSSGATEGSETKPPTSPAVTVAPTIVAVVPEAPVIPPTFPAEEVTHPAPTTPAVTPATPAKVRAPAPRPTARPRQPTGPRDDMKRTL